MLHKKAKTYDLWHFAARYSFHELEAYCREISAVKLQIAQIIADPDKGFMHFVNAGIPITLVSKMVSDVLQPHAVSKTPDYCQHCQSPIIMGIKYTCRKCINSHYCQACFAYSYKDHSSSASYNAPRHKF